MVHVRIIDVTSISSSGQLSATLQIAEIDEIGRITTHPHPGGQGELNIQSLVNLIRQVVGNFQNKTFQDQYFGGRPVLPELMIDRVADPIDELRTNIENLKDELNQTLSVESWFKIREGLLKNLIGIDLHKTIRLVIRTNNFDLQSLPLEGTSFIVQDLAGKKREISVVFDSQNKSQQIRWSDRTKILLVLGSQKDIESQINLDEIKTFFPSTAIIVPLLKPSKEKLMETITDESFDIIIIIGHSHVNTQGTDGRININDRENLNSVSIAELTRPFKESINKGLKLVILAGCSSVGLARALSSESIGVPNVIGFRMPIHYTALKQFLKRLLTRWTNGDYSLEISLTKAREELMLCDNDSPGSSMLPILFTSAYAPPLMFPKHINISPRPEPWWKKSYIWWKQSPVAIKYGLLIVMTVIVVVILNLPPSLEPACNFITNDGISCGEDILNKERDRVIQEAKQDGADEIAKKNYPTAIELLKRAWDEKKDPETLIMLENSRIKTEKLSIKSIGLNIPGSISTPSDIPNAILKGVGYAQQQWNANPSRSWNLQVVLLDDKNNKRTAPGLSTNLLRRDILATIGSYSSEVTIPVKGIYHKENTVLISGTSTTTNLVNLNPNTLFFRICSNNGVAGEKIGEYLKFKKYKKILLFHTPNKEFSASLTKALKNNILGSVEIVNDFDFRGQGKAIDLITKAKKSGAQAIVLIPDAYTSHDPERDRLLKIISDNNGDLPIIGNEVVKDETLFNYTKQQLEKLVISLPWHPSSSQQNNEIKMPAFWGDRNQLDHRIAMNYDATQVLIKALDTLRTNQGTMDSRLQIQKILSDPTFSMLGITGNISFSGSERSQQTNSLITPKCGDTKCDGFKPAI